MRPNLCEEHAMETCTFNVTTLDSVSPRIGGHNAGGAFKGTRDVWPITYDGKSAVVKYSYSIYDNRAEASVWEYVKETGIAHLFAEVYAHSEDDKFLVMERATSVLSDHGAKRDWSQSSGYTLETAELTEQYNQFRTHVVQDCARVGVDADDLHPGNVGLRKDGTMVVIDYGYFETIDKTRED